MIASSLPLVGITNLFNPVQHQSSMTQGCSADLQRSAVGKADDFCNTGSMKHILLSHRASPLHQHAISTLAIESSRQFSCGWAEQFENLGVVPPSMRCKVTFWIQEPCNIIPELSCKAMSKEIMRNGQCNCAHRNLLFIKKHQARPAVDNDRLLFRRIREAPFLRRHVETETLRDSDSLWATKSSDGKGTVNRCEHFTPSSLYR